MTIEQRIEEALKNATQGQWQGKHAINPYISVGKGVAEEVIATVHSRKDMHLIANAPEWLRHQQSIIKNQAEEIERLGGLLDRIGNICTEHENAKYQPIGTVRLIQKVAAYNEPLEENPHVNP